MTWFPRSSSLSTAVAVLRVSSAVSLVDVSAVVAAPPERLARRAATIASAPLNTVIVLEMDSQGESKFYHNRA